MATSHTVVWQRSRVVANDRLTSSIRRIELEPERPVPVGAGAHIDVRIRLGAVVVTRSYSVVDAESSGGRLAISVFDGPSSRGGAAVMHSLPVGSRVDATLPLQDFPLRPGAVGYVLLAGGIGITAILPMAEALAASNTPFRVVYCGRRRADMAYLDRLSDRHGSRLEVHISTEGTPLDVAGLVASVDPDAELYMCGPIRLMDGVRREWTQQNRVVPNLRFETFGNSGWFAPEPFIVNIPSLGVSTTVDPDTTLLDSLSAIGVDTMSDCRKGECGICESRVLAVDGIIDHRDVFYSDRQRDAASRICICVSRVCGTAGRPPSITLELS